MAKERAPRRRRRWFLLALLVSAVTWYTRSRSTARRVQLAAPWPAPPPAPAVAQRQAPVAATGPDLEVPVAPAAPPSPPAAMAPPAAAPVKVPVVEEPAVEVPAVEVPAAQGEQPASEQGHPAATGSEEGHPAATSALPPAAADLPAAPPTAAAPPTELEELDGPSTLAGSGLDIAAERPDTASGSAAAEPADSTFDVDGSAVAEPAAPASAAPEAAAPASAGVEPAMSAPDAADPVVVEPTTPDPTAAAEAPSSASPSPRPRPRPRPRQDGSAATQVVTPPRGSASVEVSTGEDTPSSGFGPTSATATPAPPHALFTPASTDGVGAGAVPGPDGEAPGPEYTIKGNADSMLFHTPASPYYERTRAEVWFRTADEAVAAGFKEWQSHRRTG